MRGAPAHEAAEEAARLRVERLELHVLHAPAAVELLHDQLRVEEELDLLRTELPGEGEGAHGPGVLGDVVRRDPDRLAARGIIIRRRDPRHRTGVEPPLVIRRRFAAAARHDPDLQHVGGDCRIAIVLGMHHPRAGTHALYAARAHHR